jgi:hypothetical protein
MARRNADRPTAKGRTAAEERATVSRLIAKGVEAQLARERNKITPQPVTRKSDTVADWQLP